MLSWTLQWMAFSEHIHICTSAGSSAICMLSVPRYCQFPQVIITIYIHTGNNRMWESHDFAKIWNYQSLLLLLFFWVTTVVSSAVLWWLRSYPFLYVKYPFGYFLLWSIYSYLLPVFLIGCFHLLHIYKSCL